MYLHCFVFEKICNIRHILRWVAFYPFEWYQLEELKKIQIMKWILLTSNAGIKCVRFLYWQINDVTVSAVTKFYMNLAVRNCAFRAAYASDQSHKNFHYFFSVNSQGYRCVHNTIDMKSNDIMFSWSSQFLELIRYCKAIYGSHFRTN